MPQISVVVPVYNIEKYIHKCIESLIHQSMKDIEIILVDDGSFDKTGEICDSYAKCDNRIIVIHKSNEGLSSARNVGIEASNSDYIMFVDGDDWVEANFCELPYNYAKNKNVDLVLFAHNRVNENGKKKGLLEKSILDG